MSSAALATDALFDENRRQLLGLGLSLAAFSMLPKKLFAAEAPSLKQGAFDITVFSDGFINLPASIVMPEASEDERDAILKRLGGTVEADETYVGGLAKNMHAHKREQRITKANASDKAVVMGLLQRGDGTVPSRVHARVIRNANARIVQGMVRQHVEPGTTLYTDSLLSYRGLGGEYVHGFVNHAVEYVRGNIHSNGVENFWSLLKRSIRGTYVSVDPQHLNAYVSEQTFRFNERKGTDLTRFRAVLRSTSGKRLTYKDLTNHALSAAA